MTRDIAQKVEKFCQKNSLLSIDDKVVIGFSGGPDSLCLLHLLKSFGPALNLEVTAAHLNHQLRGTDSQADEAFVRKIAAQWQIPLFVERQPVADLAKDQRQSLEEAARQVRYAFLWRIARKVGANKIAVGHNADDQVETVLMHFLRGTGLAGLQGMLPTIDMEALRLSYERPPSSHLAASPKLVRPLLTTWRTEIDAYCQEHNLSPQLDRSNEDVTFFRNRLRHELIPYLEGYNPNIRQVVERTAKVVRGDLEILSEQMDRAWDFVIRSESENKIEFDLYDWLSLPLGMKRSILRRAVQTLRKSLRDINFEHIESAIEVVEKGKTGTEATLPQGLALKISYHTLIVAHDQASTLPEGEIPLLLQGQVLPVKRPGITLIPASNWLLKATIIAEGHISYDQIRRVAPWEAYLDNEVVGDVAVLRSRRPGDVFSPFGMGGHSQKVTEFMINEKIPVAWRDHVPILVANDRILWICGYRLSEEARLHSATRRAVHLKFERQ